MVPDYFLIIIAVASAFVLGLISGGHLCRAVSDDDARRRRADERPYGHGWRKRP